jgi:uncharacterized protein (DUF1778 family)
MATVEPKTERIAVRVTPADRELIDQAARVLERTRGDVLRRALRAFASEVVRNGKAAAR